MHIVRMTLSSSDFCADAAAFNAGMSLSDWMSAKSMDDAQVAEMVGRDRSTICRVRTGKQRPSWELMESIRIATDGAVEPNSFFPFVSDGEPA